MCPISMHVTEVLSDWIPTHLLVLHTILLFSVLNPLVIPFGCLYYFVEVGEYPVCYFLQPASLQVAFQV